VPSNKLASFGLGDIPASAYKGHFAGAYDAAATQSAANVARRRPDAGADEPPSEQRLRLSIARRLMQRLGYTAQELELLGEDVLRMQGVRSPFAAARLREGEAVLDLGCGFGADAFLAAAKVGPSGRVLGADLSSEQLRRAAGRARERGLAPEQCSFTEADMEALPLATASLDVVISNGGFCLCPSKPAAFREVHRVLRPGGRLAIACTVLRKPLPALESRRWPPCMEVFLPRADIEGLLSGIGFSAVSVDEGSSRMDVWELSDEDLDGVAQGLGPEGGCSHARKAAERRTREEVDTFLARDREAGIHWGNPEFAHVQDFDMNELCARVVIYAEKAG